jgi:hypothetical protein
MRHIIPISGKDSLATALVQIAREPDLPYELFFNDVRAELPETYEWLNKVEKKLGKKIHRIGKSLEQIIYEKGILPAPKVRFCTCLSKIKPMEEWVGEDAATAYFGIRADEDRVGYSSSSHNITPKFPLQELGIGLPEVYRIVDSQELRPPTFLWQRMVDIVSEKLDARSHTGFRLFRNAEDTFARIPPHIFDRLFCWRSRPNCFFCLFQSKWEWVGLLEHHPELFDKAEKIETDVGGKDRRETPYTWRSDASLGEIRQNKDTIIARRAAQIMKALRTQKIVEDSNDLLQVTSCGLFCGK